MLSVKSIQTNFKKSIIRCKIANIQEGVTNISITALVIGKQEPRIFVAKETQKPKGVLSITIRDSDIDFINVSIWGVEEYIRRLNDEIQINNVINLQNPQINSKTDKLNLSKQNYKVWTPSSYELDLAEQTSDVFVVDDKEALSLRQKLENKPIRDSNDYFKLEDVVLNGQRFQDKLVNLMFVVKMMKPVEEYVNKQNVSANKLEMVIVDETNPGFKLFIWDRELIRFAQSWNVKTQVIFGVDLKLSYDSFKKCMFASTTRKTLFIINPETQDAYALYNYVKSASCNWDLDTEFLVQIAETCKIDELKLMLDSNELSNDYFTIHAFVSDFNIDFAPHKNVFRKCSICNTLIDIITETCTNQNCSAAHKPPKSIKIGFNMKMNISDETGTLINVRIDSRAIESLLGITADHYLDLEEQDIIELKWRVLLERKMVHVKVNQLINDGQKSNVIRIAKIEDS